MTSLEDNRLVKIEEVLRVCCISRATLYRRLAEGEFPAPVHVGPRVARWRVSDINSWLEALPDAAESNLN